jgi:hypothetical protein
MLLALVGVVVLVAVPAATATNTWSDPAGDSGTAPDITSVQISNSDDGALVAFLVTAPLRPGSWVGAIVDPVEGGAAVNHPRYVVIAMGSDRSVVTTVYDYYSRQVLGGIPLETTVSAEAVQFSFPAPALAIHDAFTFRVRSGDAAGGRIDEVPDFSGALSYFFSKPAPPVVPKPVIAKPTTIPAVARAGKRFTVSFKLTRSDTREALTEGTMVCEPSIAGKVLRHAEFYVASTARVSFVIPRSAKGKLLKVKVTVTLGERSATRVATFRIR